MKIKKGNTIINMSKVVHQDLEIMALIKIHLINSTMKFSKTKAELTMKHILKDPIVEGREKMLINRLVLVSCNQ